MNFAQQPIDALKVQGQKFEKELRATQSPSSEIKTGSRSNPTISEEGLARGPFPGSGVGHTLCLSLRLPRPPGDFLDYLERSTGYLPPPSGRERQGPSGLGASLQFLPTTE